MDAFFTVHRDLPREGPGLPEDVAWAIDRLDLAPHAHVLDAACGPGADLETLAGLLPDARLTGMEQVAHFVDATRLRTERFGPRVLVEQADMAAASGPFDFIWCAGALYFLGVTEGLTTWRGALAPGGAVAFSEPVLLTTPATKGARAFWADYPAITDLDGIVARVHAAGYDVIDTRLLVGAPWAAYYDPLRARIAALRDGAEPELQRALDENAREIALWEAAKDDIAYALVLVRPE